VNRPFSLKNPIEFLAVGFGSGLSPVAPGTFGTIAAIPIVFFMANLSLPVYIALTVLCAIAGIYICGKAATNVGVHDHGAIVWDEIVGYMIAMVAIPVSWHSMLVAFILFRIFDIAKPWPISWLDKHCSDGFGIMIDDVVAGLAALALMHLIY